MGEKQPQDADSGLIERRWQRTSRKGGVLTQETLEGRRVEAEWQDRLGHVRRAAGTVVRTDAGELAIESWAKGVRSQTPVTRDANVTVKGRDGR